MDIETNKIIFLDKPKNDINREAYIKFDLHRQLYWIHNSNMPYQGTLNDFWSHQRLLLALENKQVKLEE